MNAGRVELDLIAVGKDQVSAMLRQVEAQAKKTGGELQTLGEQANRAAPKVTSLGPAVGEAAKKFTTMSAAIVGGVIGGGISGVVGALTELGVGLAGAVIDFLKTEPRLDAFSAGVIAATNDAAKLTSQIAAVGKAADTASKQVAGMASKTASVYGQIARLNGDAALAAGFERQALLLSGADTIGAIETQMQAAERAANAAQTTLRGLTGPLEKARLDVVAANEALKYRRQQGLDDTVQARQLGLLANQHALLASQVAQSAEAYRIADASVVAFSDHLASLDALQDTIASPRAKADEATKTPRGGKPRTPVDTSALPYMSDEGGYISEGGDALKQTFANVRDTGAAEAARALATMRDDAGKLADELGRVADATQLVATVMPEMGAALDEVQAITAKIADGKLSLAEALAQGATAIAANAAKAIGGVRAEAAVRAAYEIGMGFATLATPVISAGHFTAGAMLGAVALGAGGGGSKSSGSGGGSAGYMPDSAARGGPGTTVWNISTLVTDPHTLQRATASSSRATAGTGIGERSAA